MLGEKIKACRKKLKLTQIKLGILLGVSGVAISKWESGDCVPEYENLLKCAAIFKVEIEWLREKEELRQNLVVSSRQKDTINYYIPLLVLEEIESWLRFPVLKQSHTLLKMTIMEENISNDSFAYTINSSYMIHPSDPAQSLLPGEIAIIDPGLKDKINVGDLVLVKFDDNDYRIRQYQEDGKSTFLKAFDTSISPTFLSENIKIIGVIISTYRNKRMLK